MLNIDVQKVTFMSVNSINMFYVDVDLSHVEAMAQQYTDFYILITLTIPVKINDAPQLMIIQKQFIDQVKMIPVSDYILRGLKLEWPGQLDAERLNEHLKGKAVIQFFDSTNIIE